MKLASYKGTRPGVQGLANRLIRWRFNGQYSHCEIVFEPADNVNDLMPDHECRPDDAGALWCASSVAWERLPGTSRYRPGRRGGVRFKRIALDLDRWDIVDLNSDPEYAAGWFLAHEGEPYSWRLVAKFISWVASIGQAHQHVCSEACASAIKLPDAWRFDPQLLHIFAKERQHG